MNAPRRFSRRSVLPVLAGPLLTACGFHPVYAPAANGAAGPVAQSLAEITVGLIPERSGQLLRLALQRRFDGAGTATVRRYDLGVSFAISAESVAIQQDSSNSRLRLSGLAQYRLTSQDPARATLTTGSARSVDDLDVFDQQFFAADQETEVVQRRIAEAIADQISLQLAVFFNRRAAAGAG